MYLNVKLMLFKLVCLVKQKEGKWPTTVQGYQLYLHKPDLFTLGKYNSNPLINLFWYLVTFGKFKILFLLDGDTVVHFSYITPKSFRFPFMDKTDLQIGPCFTDTNYRGKGIFTEILMLINSVYANKNIWIYTNLKNTPSQKAIERSGFKFHSYVKMSRLSKIIKEIN